MQTIDDTYQQTLAYLYDKLPMFTRIGAAAYKADLSNTILLCEKLGNPHLQLKCIHIAGTNGKGSTSHMLASVMQTSGYKTGLYTSPHISDFRERIRINGEMISKEWLIDFVEKMKPSIEEIQPSFFEITVAMAFAYFAEQKVDIAVIETGLGGLLDSTNIITPEISVITNISLDHTNLLGSTLAEIATQKAGIIKHNIPVVVGEKQTETESIFFTKAILQQSQIYYADNLYEVIQRKQEGGLLHLKLVHKTAMRILNVQLDLLGEYQTKNIKTVLTVVDLLRTKSWHIKEQDVYQALRTTKKRTGIRGRFDVMEQEPKIVLDVAHNEAGLREVFAQVLQMKFAKLHIICGFVRDKEIGKVLPLFPKEANYYFTQANIPRALPCKELLELGIEHQLKGQAFPVIQDAIQSAINQAEKTDLILITGSFFILDDAYSFLIK